MKAKLKKVLSLLKACLPSPLPVGLTQYEEWSNEVIELAGAPNNDSTKFTVAVMILHLDSTAAYKPKIFFVKSLKKAMSNQTVSQIIQDLKTKQAEELEAAKRTEANAITVVSDETPKS